MILNATCGSISAFAAVAVEAVATHGRRSGHLVFDVLHGAYDTHSESAQMRLTPVKPRTWHEIAAGAHVPPSGDNAFGPIRSGTVAPNGSAGAEDAAFGWPRHPGH